MESEHELVTAVHASPSRIVMAVARGGTAAIGKLLSRPGASQTVLEAIVPYSARSLVQFLGGEPERFCSAATARAMAIRAYVRACELSLADEGQRGENEGGGTERVCGVACTASLASVRPKRGPHRIHVAVQTAAATDCVSLELRKNARPRQLEEELAARLILNRTAAACGATGRLELQLLEEERLDHERTEGAESWRELLLGKREAVLARQHSAVSSPPAGGAKKPTVVFPGAFNPRHAGHRKMAKTAETTLGSPVQFEISIVNVDKPPLDYTEIARRLQQFPEGEIIWLTRAATFVEKARLFPDAVFLVGADTIARIADPRYYGGCEHSRGVALRAIAAHGCTFLVFGRKSGDRFANLRDLPLPAELASICREIPADTFREDISSSEIRRQTFGPFDMQ